VQSNIANFAGDPNRVTLLGQSSGGTNIFSLLASPASKGLFHAAISLSGSPNITMDLSQAYEQNQKIVKAVGCDNAPDVLGCLYNTSAEDLSHKLPYCYTTNNFGTLPESKSQPENLLVTYNTYSKRRPRLLRINYCRWSNRIRSTGGSYPRLT
jgi:carboxylesterase type B